MGWTDPTQPTLHEMRPPAIRTPLGRGVEAASGRARGKQVRTEAGHPRCTKSQLGVDHHGHAHTTGGVQQGGVQPHGQQGVSPEVTNHLQHIPTTGHQTRGGEGRGWGKSR